MTAKDSPATWGEWWAHVRERAPMSIALLGVAGVWLLGCVWSFTEQQHSATAKGFADAALLPLVLDGLAASMAGVAYAASLDGRPAVGARIGTALAVAASAASNGEWAWTRTAGNPATVTIAVGIPIAANLAFEVLLGELRRQVQRTRGLPAPVAVPMPRVVRLVLAPFDTFSTWRDHVLTVTAMTAAQDRQDGTADPGEPEDMPETPLDGGDPDPRPAFVPDDLTQPPAVPVPVVLATYRDGLRGRPRPVPARSAGTSAEDTQPLPVAVPAQVNAQDDQQDTDEDTPSPLSDEDIAAVLSSRNPVPGITKIAREFRVGKDRAARVQAMTRTTSSA